MVNRNLGTGDFMMLTRITAKSDRLSHMVWIDYWNLYETLEIEEVRISYGVVVRISVACSCSVRGRRRVASGRAEKRCMAIT